MTSKLLIRIAAFIILFHLLGHTVGHLTWDQPEDATMKTVVDAMQSHKAKFMGVSKSMADYHNGYSFMVFAFFGLAILTLWFSSNYFSDHATRPIVKKIIFPVGLAFVFSGVVEYIYFFPMAGILSLLAGIIVLFATIINKK